MYQCFYINCDLFVCMLQVYYLFLTHNYVYFSVKCNTIQFIVTSIEYFNLLWNFILLNSQKSVSLICTQ